MRGGTDPKKHDERAGGAKQRKKRKAPTSTEQQIFQGEFELQLKKWGSSQEF